MAAAPPPLLRQQRAPRAPRRPGVCRLLGPCRLRRQTCRGQGRGGGADGPGAHMERAHCRSGAAAAAPLRPHPPCGEPPPTSSSRCSSLAAASRGSAAGSAAPCSAHRSSTPATVPVLVRPPPCVSGTAGRAQHAAPWWQAHARDRRAARPGQGTARVLEKSTQHPRRSKPRALTSWHV